MQTRKMKGLKEARKAKWAEKKEKASNAKHVATKKVDAGPE